MTSRVSFPSRRRGVALIIILAILVIATILVVGFTVSMRTERSASASMANNERAKLLSQSALEHAISLLDSNIPQPIPPGAPFKPGDSGYAAPTNWIVNPGLLTLVTGPSTVREVPLSSNPSAAYVPSGSDANLNIGSFSGTTYAILGNDATPLRAAWINILKDPLSPAGPNNPIVGRYAFWMDDENAKINLNTAYGKPATLDLTKVNPLQQVTDVALYGTEDTTPHTDPHAAIPDPPSGNAPTYNTYEDMDSANIPQVPANLPPAKITSAQMSNSVGTSPSPRYFPLWHPSAVNLDVLGTNLDRDALSDWIYNSTIAPSAATKWIGSPSYRLLTSPDQVKQFVQPDPEDFFNRNRFFLTTESRAPEFNVFGKSRIFLERRLPYVPNVTSASDTIAYISEYDKPRPDQPIFFQADYDADGPTYFHGDENRSQSGLIPNISGIQHVADAISEILGRNDWPGMPARSFVDKWGGGTLGRLEADQVAMDIALLGQYASGGYNRITAGKRDTYWMEGMEPISSGLLSNIDLDDAAGTQWPGSKVRKGKLSGKAIVPHLPRPMVNEIVLTITPIPPELSDPNAPPPTYGSDQEYWLQFTLQVEFYLPPKVPLTNIKGQFAQKFVFTHFAYTVTGTNSTGAPVVASQSASKYLQDRGINRLGGALSPNQYSISGAKMGNQVTLAARPGYHKPVASLKADTNGTNEQKLLVRSDIVANGDGTNLSHVTNGIVNKASAPKAFAGWVDISGSFRMVVTTANVFAVQQLIPVWDNSDGSPALTAPAGMDDRVSFNFAVDLGQLGPFFAGGQSVTRSIAIRDARFGGRADHWKVRLADASEIDSESLGDPNPITPTDAYDKAFYFDSQNAFYNESPRGSIGTLSTIPVNTHRAASNDPCETLKFQPSGGSNELPDWLLLDLLGPSIWPHTYMNSTLGKVNANATIYPTTSIDRWVPLQAVFQNMRPNSTISGGSTSLDEADASSVVRNVLNHTLASGGNNFGAPGRYDYIGELCEIAGVADTGATDFEKEALVRNLANILTTQSNTFRIWGIAQTIRKSPKNSNYGQFEDGDAVTGENRFSAVVERSVWPGRDGVPGNGHVAADGAYDRIASSVQVMSSSSPFFFLTSPVTSPAPWDSPMLSKNMPTSGSKWAVIDGPDAPTYSPQSGGAAGNWADVRYESSSLQDADNPLRALMKYRVKSFSHLTEE